MGKFIFLLEDVLKYRRNIEEQEKELLSRAIHKVQEEEKALQKLSLQKRASLRVGNPETFDLATMQQREAYSYFLDYQITSKSQELAEAQKTFEICRTRTVKASTNRKILERLKEKNWEEYQSNISRQEQKFLDDIGIAAYCRKAESQ